jgi:hypothetical protein
MKAPLARRFGVLTFEGTYIINKMSIVLKDIELPLTVRRA